MVVVRRNLTVESWTTIVVPFTDAEGKRSGIIKPLILAGRGSGLSKDSLAVCDQVRSVDRRRLIVKIGKLSSADFTAIMRGLYEIFDFDGTY
jgi:mRNA-degrading endonuclease toxin of MazEF toxin-antitoxin module